MSLVQVWQEKRVCTKQELLQLIGKLAHATKVVVAGRNFLRRMIDTVMTAKHLNHHVHLRAEFHSDLAWWSSFLPLWNARSLMSVHSKGNNPQIIFSTDASGSWGCGAVWNSKWIQCKWDSFWPDKSIALKEFLPIVLACVIWGPLWAHSRVQVLCDNAAVISIVNARTSKRKDIMHLLRYLHFFLAFYDVTIKAVHIPGVLNNAADTISRNHPQVLHQVLPSALPLPDPVPLSLWSLLVRDQHEWTSVDWRMLLASCVRPV